MFGENDAKSVLIVALLTFLINVPFGYWRAQVKRFSVNWFLAIHLPVPFIVVLRFLFGVQLNLTTILTFVIAFFLGQRTGILLYEYLRRKRTERREKNPLKLKENDDGEKKGNPN